MRLSASPDTDAAGHRGYYPIKPCLAARCRGSHRREVGKKVIPAKYRSIGTIARPEETLFADWPARVVSSHAPRRQVRIGLDHAPDSTAGDDEETIRSQQNAR